MFLGVCILGGERGMASDSLPLLSFLGEHVASTRSPQPEEIQEFVMSAQVRPLAMKSVRERDDLVFADVYFDEKRVLIDERLKGVFLRTARLLVEQPQWRLHIEGHCDPRGPSAYNFARANFHLAHLTHYLSLLGISSHQISTVNYGQDPVSCRDTSERCQEDNLRAEKIFPLLSVGYTQRGCLARLRLTSGGNRQGIRQVTVNFSSLQRVHVAAPSSSF